MFPNQPINKYLCKLKKNALISLGVGSVHFEM